MAAIADQGGAYAILDQAGNPILDQAGLPSAISPAWLAARAGLPGAVAAPNYASQIAQFLAAHGITPVYAGTQVIAPAGSVGYGYGGIDWADLGACDVDQPVTMPGGATAIGRVTLPLSPVGAGADVTVSLCADSGGSPGAVLASTRVPASWIAQLAAPSGLAAGGALAVAQGGTLRMNDMTAVTWASPVAAAGAPTVPACAQSGSYLIQAGGDAVGGAAFSAAVFTAGWQGGASPGIVLPQPSLPAVVNFGALIATGAVLVYAGGQPTAGTVTATVSAASWSPSSGQVQGWTAQAPLPQAVWSCAGASDPASGSIYVIGGDTSASGGAPTAAVRRSAVSNGQLGAWGACPPLPSARQGMAAAVVGGWLVACGGSDGVTAQTATWLAPVLPGGALGAWQQGPPMPQAVSYPPSFAVTASGLVLFAPGAAPAVLTLTVTADGAGQWQSQALDAAGLPGLVGGSPCAAFPSSPGQWRVTGISPVYGEYYTGVLSSVPAVSVPLPAAGLASGGAYHVLVRQDGGDLNDYVTIGLDPYALATAAQTRPSGGGSWTGLGNGYSMLAGIWDQAPGGQVLHTWEDDGARITAMVYGAAYGQLMGLCEATAFADGTMLASVTEVAYSSAGQPSGLVQLA
jgi:hypothetical protein